MAQQVINIGTSPNDGTGDQLRTAFEKCNDNFTELYASSGAVDSVNGQTGVVVLDATDVDALQRDGSNANSDIDIDTFSFNAKSIHAKGTAGAGHLGLKHQSSNATASASETSLFAGSDGELYYKNDGNAVQQLASQSFVNTGLATKQDTLTNPITGTGASGQVAFFNGATTQLGDNGLFWDNTNKRLGIGTTSPQSRLNVFGTDELLRFGDGTSGNDAFMSFNSRGFVGFRGTGGLNFIANTSRPIIFGIGNTFSSFTECARFSAVNGNFLINTATDSGFRLDVNGTTRLNGNTSIGGGTAGARLDVRAQGALSTDIAFRVRNSADTANLLQVNGLGGVEINSTTQGFLPPRMTTTQRNAIASPAAGLIVYDTTLNKLCVRTASAWETITSI